MPHHWNLGPSVVKLRPEDTDGVMTAFEDWCHICGDRVIVHLEIFYPDNAEHARFPDEGESYPHTRYVRICENCIRTLAQCLPGGSQSRSGESPGNDEPW